MAFISLPKGVTKDQIDSDKSLTLYPGGIEAVNQRIFNIGSGRCGNQHAIIFACFDKDDILAAVPDNGPVELQVVGRLKTGQYLCGSDTIIIKHWRWPPWPRRCKKTDVKRPNVMSSH